MNKSNAKQYLPLAQALAEGKTIQYRRSVEDDWVDLNNVSFVYAPTRYRIKPERIKKKMWYKDCMLCLFAENYGVWSEERWLSEGYQLIEIEFDAP